jgi:hypothetical protein
MGENDSGNLDKDGRSQLASACALPDIYKRFERCDSTPVVGVHGHLYCWEMARERRTRCDPTFLRPNDYSPPQFSPVMDDSTAH